MPLHGLPRLAGLPPNGYGGMLMPPQDTPQHSQSAFPALQVGLLRECLRSRSRAGLVCGPAATMGFLCSCLLALALPTSRTALLLAAWK